MTAEAIIQKTSTIPIGKRGGRGGIAEKVSTSKSSFLGQRGMALADVIE